MLRSGENETEILLGNRQLLGIFFVVAALLGMAFTGGYMLGRGPKQRKSAEVAVNTPAPATPAAGSASGGETHSVPASEAAPANDAATQPGSTEEPLGSPKRKSPAVKPAAPAHGEDFVPQGGQEYLQVAAVAHDDATAVAAVLRRKGFRAHAVPKPGNPNLYRVIVGPIRDPGDLATTRDSLRKTGFRDVIVQHYQ